MTKVWVREICERIFRNGHQVWRRVSHAMASIEQDDMFLGWYPTFPRPPQSLLGVQCHGVGLEVKHRLNACMAQPKAVASFLHCWVYKLVRAEADTELPIWHYSLSSLLDVLFSPLQLTGSSNNIVIDTLLSEAGRGRRGWIWQILVKAELVRNWWGSEWSKKRKPEMTKVFSFCWWWSEYSRRVEEKPWDD